MGRSYGDAAQLAGGLVLETTHMRSFELDRERGLLTAQAGATIGELLRALVPAGWMVPVVPGTQHVSVGGAIASDIHGKNHGTAGTFGSHVRALGLLTAGGEILELEPGSTAGLFEATLGGMGLTGVIVWARIAMRPVRSPLVCVDTDRVDGIDAALSALSLPGGSHRVAWLDLLRSGRGRGIVTRAEHLECAAPVAGRHRARRARRGDALGRHGHATVQARATVPEHWPGALLRPGGVRAFNELRFRTAPRHERGRIEGLGAHMFPLDALDAWPRLYGRQGLLQYQIVVPPGQEHILHAVIGRLRRARIPSYLAVLKDFGPANAAPLSFPIEGWTLALDIPRGAPDLDRVLDQCDELVIGAGGRVYLSKDARLAPDAVRAMYPRLGEWRAIREAADPDGLWRSDLALRTGLVAR
jgi:decaprenylphospho-beta-D-ribofuranose 2-oxidase